MLDPIHRKRIDMPEHEKTSWGAVLLAVAYKLFMNWVDEDDPLAAELE
jgi:hypothetical protein